MCKQRRATWYSALRVSERWQAPSGVYCSRNGGWGWLFFWFFMHIHSLFVEIWWQDCEWTFSFEKCMFCLLLSASSPSPSFLINNKCTRCLSAIFSIQIKSPWQYLYPYTNTNISIFNLTSMKGFLNICVTELNEHNLLCVHGWQRYSFFSIHLFHLFHMIWRLTLYIEVTGSQASILCLWYQW